MGQDVAMTRKFHRIEVTDLQQLSPEDFVVAYSSEVDSQANDPKFGGIIQLIRPEQNPGAWSVRYRQSGARLVTDGLINFSGDVVYKIPSSSHTDIGKSGPWVR